MLTRIYRKPGRDVLIIREGEKQAKVTTGRETWNGNGKHWLEKIAEGVRLQGELTEDTFWAALVFAMGVRDGS